MIARRAVLGLGGSALAAMAWPAEASGGSKDLPALTPRAAEALTPIVEALGAPGVAVTVIKSGEAAGFGAWGMASLEFEVPVGPQTLFHLGSLGKHVTALGVLQLVEAGLVVLDRAIGDYVRDLPASWSPVPVRALLNQVSGLPDYTAVVVDFDRPQSRADILKAVTGLEPAFAPGQAWSYSNTNYLLLGWLIEDVSRVTYPDYVAQRLFARAETPTARPDAGEQVIKGRAEAYQRDGDHFVHAPLMDDGVSHSPDGGMLFSARDFGPWTRALTSGQLVSAATMREALTPGRLNSGRGAPYGFGWFLGRTRGKPYHFHPGAVPGFSALYLCLPEAGAAVAVTANADGGGRHMRRMAWTAAEAYAPGSTFLSLPPIAADPVDARVLAVLSAGASVKPDPDLFAPELLAVHANAATHRRALFSFKPPITLTPIEQYEAEGGARMRRYRAAAGALEDVLVAGFDAAGKLFWLNTD